MNDEQNVTAEQARQTPWIRRNKAERHAIYEEREAKRKSTYKRRMDRVEQMKPSSPPPSAPAARPNQPAAAPRPRRRWYQRRPWKWIIFWGGLTGDDGVYIPGTGPGDRTTGP